jgi:hypothetical protein
VKADLLSQNSIDTYINIDPDEIRTILMTNGVTFPDDKTMAGITNAFNKRMSDEAQRRHLNIVFDTDTQEVYVVEACDYSKDRAYRFINPAFEENHNKEMKNRKIDNTAWDDVNWIDLAVYEDWKEKTMAIVAGEDYDTRVQIPLDLEEDEIFKLMCMAHERDITLNEFVVEILTNVIESNK